MISICICDDNEEFAKRCKEDISKEIYKKYKNVEIEIFLNGESLLFGLDEDYNKFDIIIMDVFMKDLNGIETARSLRDKGFVGEIIFLSSSREYALESFEVEPLYYVLKDQNYTEKLHEVLLRCIGELEENKEKKLIIDTKQKRVVLYFRDILYIECVGKKIYIYRTSGEVEVCNNTLNVMEEKTKEQGLLRCHKSFIVNCFYVEYFSKTDCTLRNKVHIPIGRKYTKMVQETLTQYQMDHILI